MATRRLSESQKRQLVDSYRAGETSARLADAYGCSVNTVTRTLKTFLSEEDYASLKASRVRGATKKEIKAEASESKDDNFVVCKEVNTLETLELNTKASSQLALDDAEDFDNSSEEDSSIQLEESFEGTIFQEVVPLMDQDIFDDHREIKCKPLVPGVLPESVYMLVEKTVELEARPLSDFPELGSLSELDKERKALYLFSNPRSAKRQCGRNQRVIKIPNTNVFNISTPFLLARGISRLIVEGSLIALDI
ncbi:helix-turn-helix domain-containing protein [Prochlorococcus sp. MIT 1341]|uniref:helix-turn-helix domain-containing protein n=1 Tax=Prochlorococcus sp. MIT 1341 TaxID=3096221 RepID=UPI0039C00099